MPIINDTITQVMELRMQGQFDLANSKVELLKETLTRYDEKLDVDRFIPKQELDEQGQPVAQANAMAQSAQMQEQFMIAKQNDAEKAAKVQADQVIAAAQEQAKAAESDAKRMEAQARAAEAAAKEERVLEAERYKIDQDREAKEYAAQQDREAKEYGALIDAATSLIAAEIAASAKPKEEGAEGEASGGNGKLKPEAIPAMMKGFMEQLSGMVEAMKGLAGPRSVTIKKGDDGTFSGESSPT